MLSFVHCHEATRFSISTLPLGVYCLVLFRFVYHLSWSAGAERSYYLGSPESCVRLVLRPPLTIALILSKDTTTFSSLFALGKCMAIHGR